jgi:hypothetical protein
MDHKPETIAPFIDEAEQRRAAGQLGPAVRALSTVIENNPSNAEMARMVGYRIDAWGQKAEAAALFHHVLAKRPFEPQSYRDLANSLWLDRPALSAMMFEAVLAGDWNPKYRDMFKTVVAEEYALMINQLATQSPGHALNGYLAQRKNALGIAFPSGDLRVTITWNTDNTDIDLWVTDPNGEKCFYSNKLIASGGELLDDMTQGYGPERFQAIHAIPGNYVIQVHYYGNNGNQLVAETFVNAAVVTRAGSSEEHVERYNITLTHVNDVATVAEVTF